VPDSHPLARRASIALAELRVDDWVTLAESAFPGRDAFLRAAGEAAGFTPRVVAAAESVPLMLAAVATGSGVAIAPRHAQKLPHAGCVFVPLRAPAPVVELLLVTARGGEAGELRLLTQLLQARARTLADG
jgi:DNA-binding transcriptional LysR family regulator